MIKRLLLITVTYLVAHYGGGLIAAETNNAALPLTVSTMEFLDNQRKLGPGDKVTYRVVEDKDEPRSLLITDTGELEVPYYGLVRASGKTSLQLAREVKKLLERDLYYQATVIIAVEVVNKTRVAGRVYVTGQVRNTGSFEIPAGEDFTVTQAIIKAGGFSDFSDKKNVRLIRKTAEGKKTFVINVVDILKKGNLERDMAVQADDMIVVPESLINY
jgi:protein involved in polysaccharide export with SLBB domain